MTNGLLRLSTLAVLAAFFTLLAGCGSSLPTRYYVLHSWSEATHPKEEPPSSAEGRCVSIGVGPVKIADYLDRAEIVTRVAPNELRLAEFDQWAEPLSQNISRVLADNLPNLLCAKSVVVFPWRGSVSIDYQIEVEVLRMDGTLGGDATLEARWMVLGSGEPKKLLVVKKTRLTVPTGGQGFQALVSAQSHNLESLSRHIATAINDLPR